MNKRLDQNPQITLSLLVTLTIAIAIVGMAAEVIFITNHLEFIGRELSLLTSGQFPR
jgi:hypothetical protein